MADKREKADQETQSHLWVKWFDVARERILDTRTSRGPEMGSWFNPHDVNAKQGGRLYQTAINAMTLEVYYRHLPVWNDKAAGALEVPAASEVPQPEK